MGQRWLREGAWREVIPGRCPGNWVFIPAGSAGPDLGGLSAAQDTAGLLWDRLCGCTELVGPQHPFPMALMGTTGCVTPGRGLWARGERFVQLTSCNKPALVAGARPGHLPGA